MLPSDITTCSLCRLSSLPPHPQKRSDWAGDISGSYFKLLNVQYCIFIAPFFSFPPTLCFTRSCHGVSGREGKNVLKLLFVCLFASVYHFLTAAASPGCCVFTAEIFEYRGEPGKSIALLCYH